MLTEKTIVEHIRADLLRARKDKMPRLVSILSFALSEATANPVIEEGVKTFPDTKSIPIIKKIINNIYELVKLKTNEDEIIELENEITVLSTYLPRQLDDVELEEAIVELKESGLTNMGQIMQGLKSRYDGQYEGKKASEIAKRIL